MKHLQLLGAAALMAALSMTACKPKTQPGAQPAAGNTSATGGRIAYVDIDSFEAHYESLKKKRDEFKTQQESMENELAKSAQQMQADYTAVMRKQQQGTLTQAEGESAQRRLSQMQQSLETRRAAMATQFQDKLDAFNDELHEDLDAFLADYTKDHNLDYVLSYSRGNAQILYANKAFDITADVIKGMNERAQKGDAAAKDTAKGK